MADPSRIGLIEDRAGGPEAQASADDIPRSVEFTVLKGIHELIKLTSAHVDGVTDLAPSAGRPLYFGSGSEWQRHDQSGNKARPIPGIGSCISSIYSTARLTGPRCILTKWVKNGS